MVTFDPAATLWGGSRFVKGPGMLVTEYLLIRDTASLEELGRGFP
jgi:hypothetical protein